MLADKIEKRLEDLDAYIVGVCLKCADGGHDCDIKMEGDGNLQMAMLAGVVKMIGDGVGKTNDEVLDDLRALIHEVERDEN